MLRLEIPITQEGWDAEKNEFVDPETKVLELEHSLVSVSKWESKWCKPFLTKSKRTSEETLDYIKCMTLNEDVDPSIYNFLTDDNIRKINEYIDSPNTATTIREAKNGRGGNSIVTSEVIYSWMVNLQIPFECQYWHLNRLITLVKVCNIQNSPQKKRSNNDILRENAALNEARRKRLNTKG